MPYFFIYLLKVNIALVLFYLIYHFALRPLTFYKANRFYLLFAICCSALFPLVQLTIQNPSDDTATVLQYMPNWNDAVAAISRPGISWNTWDVLYIIYWLGVLVMFTLFITGFISLFRMWHSSQKINGNGVPLRITEKNISPFAFWNTIFVNPETHSAAELQTIIRHEMIHVRQWHTADILLAELNRIFYWFNPGAWLMKRAIRENLEFIADEQVLNSGEDKTIYQYTLLQTVTGMPVANGITSRFAFTHLKNRISMMNKKRTAAMHYMRYLLLLPLLAVVAIVFARAKTTVQPLPQNVAGTAVNDTIPVGVKVKNSRNQMMQVSTKNGQTIVTAEKNGQRKTINWSTATKEEKKKWEEEFGELPPPPPPPPPPGKQGTPPPPPPPPPPPAPDGDDIAAPPITPEPPGMPAKAPMPPLPPLPPGTPAPELPPLPPMPPMPAKEKKNTVSVTNVNSNINANSNVNVDVRPAVATTVSAPVAVSVTPKVTTTVASAPVAQIAATANATPKASVTASVATTVNPKIAVTVSPVATTAAPVAY